MAGTSQLGKSSGFPQVSSIIAAAVSANVSNNNKAAAADVGKASLSLKLAPSIVAETAPTTGGNNTPTSKEEAEPVDVGEIASPNLKRGGNDSISKLELQGDIDEENSVDGRSEDENNEETIIINNT